MLERKVEAPGEFIKAYQSEAEMHARVMPRIEQCRSHRFERETNELNVELMLSSRDEE